MLCDGKLLSLGCLFAYLTVAKAVYNQFISYNFMTGEAPAEFVYPNGFGQPKNRLNEKVYFVREDPTHQTILAAVPGLQMKRLFDEMPPERENLPLPFHTRKMLNLLMKICTKVREKSDKIDVVLLGAFGTENRAHLQDILLKQERPGIDQTKVMTIFAAGKFADPNLRYINSQGKKYNDLSDVEILSMLTNFFDWFKPGLLYEYMTFKFYQLQADKTRDISKTIIIPAYNSEHDSYIPRCDKVIPRTPNGNIDFILVSDAKWLMYFDESSAHINVDNAAHSMIVGGNSKSPADVYWVSCPNLNAITQTVFPEILFHHLARREGENLLSFVAIFSDFNGLKFRNPMGLEFGEIPFFDDRAFKLILKTLKPVTAPAPVGHPAQQVGHPAQQSSLPGSAPVGQPLPSGYSPQLSHPQTVYQPVASSPITPPSPLPPTNPSPRLQQIINQPAVPTGTRTNLPTIQSLLNP